MTRESYVVRVTREAMACEFEVRLNAGQYPHATEHALEALDLVDRLEDQLSVFRPESEISRINRTAADGPVAVEPGLFALLETAMRLHAETDGALDLTATPLWEVWGFARRQGAIPDAERLRQALALVGSRWIDLDAEHRTIRFRKPGVRLSLGSIGKGYALDACGARLRAAGIDDFLLHGGNSSVLAAGCPRSGRGASAPALAAGWEVGIVHPLRPNRRLGTLLLTGRALGTSGAWAQSFVHEGRRYGHILDPRTGQPADGLLSATALAPTAAEADALATAFFVLGPDGAADYCERHPGIAAVLACPIRRQGGLEIRTAGLEQGEFRAAE